MHGGKAEGLIRMSDDEEKSQNIPLGGEMTYSARAPSVRCTALGPAPPHSALPRGRAQAWDALTGPGTPLRIGRFSGREGAEDAGLALQLQNGDR